MGEGKCEEGEEDTLLYAEAIEVYSRRLLDSSLLFY